MSFQTGTSAASGPASSRLVDRARYRAEKIRSNPNPIWVRELRQASRLGRTPVLLMIAVLSVALLVAGTGAVASTYRSPAQTGAWLFQIFFSLAYFLVMICGPAIAANSVAQEREGRTWEALILTGISPGEIARGKFLSAFTTVTMYVVALAPIGALPFLFGGVTATEIVVAFGFLLLIALIGVSFGLALAARMASLRGALILTFILSLPFSVGAFFTFGFALSFAAHEAWPAVAEGAPVWLPTAYARAPFGLEYVLGLLVAPVAVFAIPAWFFYEASVAALTSFTDDRSFRLKRWYLVSLAVVAVAAAALPFGVPKGAFALTLAGLAVVLLFSVFAVFVFAGDPVGPSRRVQVAWERAGAGRVRRFLGPGVARSASLLVASGLSSAALVAASGALAVHLQGAPGAGTELAGIGLVAAYWAGFFVFVVGLGAFLRARAKSAIMPRVALAIVQAALYVAPWVGVAFASILSHGSDAALVLGAPSPFFALVAAEGLTKPDPAMLVAAALAAGFLYAALGALLLGLARRRARRVIAEHEALLAEASRVLAEEDAARAAPRTGTSA